MRSINGGISEMTIQEMFNNRRLGDLYVLARYFYRIGNPIMADDVYEKYVAWIKQHPEGYQEYLDRTYDDDPIPYDLLKELGIEPEKPEVPSDNKKQELMQYLNEEKSLSIDSVTDYSSAFGFFNSYRIQKKDLMISLKMDGVNAKSLYLEGKRELSLSRGRNGNSFDFTDNLNGVLPNKINAPANEIKTYTECYVDYGYLDTLRQKYNADKYKMAKSAAISLLRVKHQPEDYQHLHAVVINVEGLPTKTLEETFTFMQNEGFEVPEHKLISYKEIPEKFEDFCKWLKQEVFDYMYERTKGIPSDGIVVEVNDLTYEGITTGIYSNRQLALKFEQWNFNYYEGVVEDIIWEQQRVYANCKLRIAPVNTKDSEARIINAFNMGVIIEEGITKGSKIYFERNSDAVNILIYGDRLKKIKESKNE